MKDVFNVNALDLQLVAKAFGLSVPPKVQLSIGASMKGDKKTRKGKKGIGGDWTEKLKGQDQAFSANNPCGQRQVDDKRQFSH